MIKAGLTTTSGGKMFATFRMIYIEAKCSDKKVKLKAGKKMAAKMTFCEKKKRYESVQRENE